MAIHKTVFYTPDRQYRITADANGKIFTVERSGVFVARIGSIRELELWLTTVGLVLADLVED